MWFAVGSSAIAGQWQGHAGNPQHTAQAPATAQKVAHVHWSTPIDTTAQIINGDIYIHYGSAMITAANTALLPVKTSDTGSEPSGNFRIEAHNAKTGALIWTQTTDYVAPPHNWTPMFGPQLTAGDKLWYPGAGGTVYYRAKPDSANVTPVQIAFYGINAYKNNAAAANAGVFIDTPINSDPAGNIYFGFTVTGTAPARLKSGIARISATGKGTWISAAATIGGSASTKVQTNSAPAVSNDGSTIYITVRDDGAGGAGYLVGLDATTLQPRYKAALKDPVNGGNALVSDDSSATPTIGPDGDVYIGVLEANFPSHNDRGWLLHFDATLATQKTPGSFGWDDTVSTVPASTVPSYHGTSRYLIMSKYNNYADFGIGDGENKIAILDPNATQADEYNYGHTPVATVMKEVLTILGPTQDALLPGVDEWCISSAAVDPSTKSVLVNSEDGHAYRWNLATNTLSQSLLLNPPRGEAYTQTVVGVDGTVYAVNNAVFYAIGN
jgi:hypothetical protein